jgi:hypothetical protein
LLPLTPRAKQYYAWFYDGSQLLLQLSGFGMILLMLAGVMFPLWPASLRVGVWYLSIGVLGLIGAFFGLAILRLIFYCISLVVLRPGVWIFPNLFEDVGFVSRVSLRGWCRPLAARRPQLTLTPPPPSQRSTRSSRSGHGTFPRPRRARSRVPSMAARLRARDKQPLQCVPPPPPPSPFPKLAKGNALDHSLVFADDPLLNFFGVQNLPGQAGPAEANVSSAPEAAPSAPAATPKNRGNGGGGGGGAGGAAATASQQQQTPARRIERPSENLSALD